MSEEEISKFLKELLQADIRGVDAEGYRVVEINNPISGERIRGIGIHLGVGSPLEMKTRMARSYKQHPPAVIETIEHPAGSGNYIPV